MNLFQATWQWLTDPAHWSGNDGIPTRLGEHLHLSFESVAIGALIALPVGIVLGHYGRFGNLAINISNVGRAVPSFGILVIAFQIFGLGDLPQILIAFMLGVVAMIVNTLNGLDRVPPVLLKTGRIMRLTPIDTALRLTLPAAGPYILTGVKLAVAYAFIGIIGSEFILSRGGIGYEINFAYNNFDNATMYPLIVLILLASIAINTVLTRWEKTLLARRGAR